MKKWIAMLLSLMLMVSLCACVVMPATQQDEDETKDAAAPMKTFTVTVVHKDGTSKDFTYETTEEFVGPVLEAEGLIEGNAGPYGMEITKVDGEQAIYNEDKAYWAVYEGEEYALQGIDTTPAVDGGVYKLVYTGA